MPTRRPPIRAARPRLALAATASLAVALTLALSGCGTAPWLDDSAGVTGSGSGTGSGATSTSTPAPSYPETSTRTRTKVSTPTPTPTIAVIVNDLASGSAARTVAAGDVSLAINYWSTLRMDQWTSAASKPINFSLSASLGSDSGQKIFLSKMTVVATVTGPNGVLTAPPVFTDQATVSPGYDMKKPQSYGQVVLLPPVEAAATSITLNFTYEVLVQTNTKVPTYSKQTATDSLTVALTE